MLFILALCAFVFVLGGLGALDSMRQNEAWGGLGILSALGFAGMVTLWVLFTGN